MTADKRYFIRNHNRIQGPFPTGALRAMQRRRIVTRTTLLSESRTDNWVQASDLPDLFPEGDFERETPTSIDEMQWFYVAEGNRVGPVTLTNLKQLAEAGQLAPYDNVMSEAMATWVPARSVQDLSFKDPSNAFLWTRNRVIFGTVVLILSVLIPVVSVIAIDQKRIAEEQIAVQKGEAEEVARRLREERIEEQRIADLRRRVEASDQRQHEIELARIAAQAKKSEGEEQRKHEIELAKLANQTRTDSNSEIPQTIDTSSGQSQKSLDGFKLGDRVKNPSFFMLWSGTVVRIEGQTLRVRIDYSSGQWGSGRFAPGIDYSFLPSEVKLKTVTSLGEIGSSLSP